MKHFGAYTHKSAYPETGQAFLRAVQRAVIYAPNGGVEPDFGQITAAS